jgi:hypothetical protein
VSDRYVPGPAEHPDVTRAALDAATRNQLSSCCNARDVVLGFLDHMSQNYVGDYYIEGSLAHLASMVRELEYE